MLRTEADNACWRVIVLLLAAAALGGHWADAADRVDDEIAAQRSEIALLRGQFGDDSLTDAQRRDALAQAEQRLARLIELHPDHWQRPMWLCDLAEMWLFDDLGAVHQHAILAMDFGVPTAEQRAAIDRLAPAALAMMEQARTSFVRLERTLPREDDHRRKRLDTGLWLPWLTCRQVNLPMLRALAAYAAALGADPAVTDAQRDIWLRRIVLADATTLASQADAPDAATPATQAQAALLASRAALRLGERQIAAAHLAVVEAELAVTGRSEPVITLTAALTRARLAAADGDIETARTRLLAAQEQAAFHGDPSLGLIVRDARYRMAASGVASAAVRASDAFAPLAVYRELFDLQDSASLVQQRALAWRWLAAWPNAQEAADLPAFVVLAMADAALQAGSTRDDDSAESSHSDPATNLFTDAQAGFARCRELTGELLKRADLDTDARARAMRLQGWAIYESAPLSPQAHLDAARVWTDLARRQPASAGALSALGDAVTLLRELHRVAVHDLAAAVATPDPAMVDRAYADAAQLLIDQFPTSAAADDERLYYAYAVLMPAGRYDEAAIVLGDVPPTHRDHLAARRELMYARLAKYQQAPWYRRPELAESVRRAAEQLENAAEVHAVRHDRARATEAYEGLGPRRAAGPDEREIAAAVADARVHARLVQTELAIDRQAIDAALDLLDEAEQLAGKDAALHQNVWERRIYALMQAGRLTQAAEAARQMLAQFPGEAVQIIHRLIDRVGQPTDVVTIHGEHAPGAPSAAEAQAAEQRQRRVLELTGELAQLVLQGDETSASRLSPEQRQQFELMAARAAALAGDLDQAERMLRRLIGERPDDALVIHHLAETLFEQAQPAHDQTAVEPAARAKGEEAVALSRRLLDGLDARSSLWWNTWLRTLQWQAGAAKTSGLGRDVDVFLTVRQLEAIDPELGGEPYRSALRRLAREHEPVADAP